MAFTREMKTYPTLAGPKRKRKQHARRIARDRFRPPGGGTIQDMKNRVAALQLELAAALREAIRTGLRSDALKVKRLVKYIPRDKTCQGFAVYRTIAALGARTPGIGDVDRPVKQATYERMIELVWIAVKKPHSYKATPLKRIYIPKPNGNLRPLSIPSYIDRTVQTLYNIVLDVFQEESADQRSFGFRRFRSPGWAAKSVSLSLWQRKKLGLPKYAVSLDITKCFERIDHEFILTNVSTTNIGPTPVQIIPRPIMKSWLKQGFIDTEGTLFPQNEPQPTHMGVPQGGPISPTISNIVLNGIENCVDLSHIIPEQPPWPARRFQFNYDGEPFVCILNCANMNAVHAELEQLGKSRNPGATNYLLNHTSVEHGGWSFTPINTLSARLIKDLTYFRLHRFADDCLFFVNSPAALQAALIQINAFLAIRGLEASPEKLKISEPPKLEFKFVGFQFSSITRHGETKQYCYPPRKAVEQLIAKVKRNMPQYPRVIRPLNKKPFKYFPYPHRAFRQVLLILRGWANFYRSANSSNTFRYLRYEIFHITRKYLYTYLYRGKKFAVGKKTDDTALYQFMWQKYLIKVGKSRYWGIQLTPRTTRHNDQSFQLLDLGTVPVATPKIIEGLSAYHPDDQPKLLRKAVEWQWGIRGQLLHKSKGLCQCCGTILIDQKSELHHYVPLVLGGSNHPNNLRVLCIHCHKDIPRKFTDPPSEKVLYYIDIGLLSPAVLPRPRNV